MSFTAGTVLVALVDGPALRLGQAAVQGLDVLGLGDVPFDHLRYVKYLANNEARAELKDVLAKQVAKIISG